MLDDTSRARLTRQTVGHIQSRPAQSDRFMTYHGLFLLHMYTRFNQMIGLYRTVVFVSVVSRYMPPIVMVAQQYVCGYRKRKTGDIDC